MIDTIGQDLEYAARFSGPKGPPSAYGTAIPDGEQIDPQIA